MEGHADRRARSGLRGRFALMRRGPLATAILLGMGFTILLWLAAGVDLVWRFQRADREANALTDRVLQVEQALESIRTSILLGAIDWRDSLLDGGESTTGTDYMGRLRQHQAASTAGLAELAKSGDAIATSAELIELGREVEDYWASVLPIIAVAPVQRPGDIRRLMRERVIPRRAIVERIVQQVQMLNRVQLQQQSRREAETYARSQTRFLVTGSLALILSLGVGAFVTGYVGRLEQALRTQLEANAQNAADLHRLSARLVRAQEDERRLIARELHDEVGQALTAVKMQLAVARRSVPPGQATGIDEARDVADSALQSARQLSRLLHPPMLEDMGLVPALDSYLKTFGDRTGILTELEHAGMDDRPGAATEICLFRIVQEATTNIAKHASATACHVYLQRLSSSVVLTVEDDGRGFVERGGPADADDGLGLLGIKERVADARGTFRLETAPGRGTRLWVELPAARQAANGTGPASTPSGSQPGKETTDGPHSAGG
jgi:signal transduction histidine kinase